MNPSTKFRSIRRVRLEQTVFAHTHRDYRGVVDGNQSVLALRSAGTTLVPLAALTVKELLERLPKKPAPKAKRFALPRSADLDVANTILAQLGGPRFLAMTGAKGLVGGPAALSFKLPRGAKDGINAVRVVLDASDTYTVAFLKVGRRGTYSVKTIAETSGVYGDGLQALFTSRTGLHTHL